MAVINDLTNSKNCPEKNKRKCQKEANKRKTKKTQDKRREAAPHTWRQTTSLVT
jgi:hypothetical protein